MKFLCQSRFVAASALADAGVNYQTDMQTFWKCSRALRPMFQAGGGIG